MLRDEREGRLRRLLVALDRRRLPAPDLPSWRIVTWTTSAQSCRLAADDERLRQLETDDLGAHLHARTRPTRRCVATYAATSANSWPETSPAGIMPRPVATTASTSSAVSPLPRSAGPTPPDRVGAVASGAASPRRRRRRARRSPGGAGRGGRSRRRERVPHREREVGRATTRSDRERYERGCASEARTARS